MKYTLKNNNISVTIDDKGAQMLSIKSIDSNYEYLWTADSKYWGRHAPNLFPIVGALKENRYEYNGENYTMSQHGFARDSIFECINETDDLLVFVMSSTDETKKVYPFDFKFYVEYKLYDNSVDVTYKVENLTDGQMYFSVGAHPGFLCNGDLTDYVIEFNEEESGISHQLNADGILDPQTSTCPFEKDKKTIKVTKELFDDGVYAFKNMNSNAISLRNTKTQKAVTVEYKGFDYLGIWAPAGAPFVCLEPWYGIADTAGTSFDYSQKEGIQMLEKGNAFYCTHTITVK